MKNYLWVRLINIHIIANVVNRNGNRCYIDYEKRIGVERKMTN